jgi:hypothetical protein
MWSFCENSVPDGSCNGFLLLNGKSQNLLNKTLNEDNKIYVQNTTRMAQSNDISTETRESLVREVLRFIPREESKRKEGLIGMIEESRGFSSTSERTEPEPEEERITSVFQAMLNAQRSTEPSRPSVVERQFDFETQLPFICTESCPIKRHCGSFPSNAGNVCVKQTEQFKNKYMVRSAMKDETR